MFKFIARFILKKEMTELREANLKLMDSIKKANQLNRNEKVQHDLILKSKKFEIEDLERQCEELENQQAKLDNEYRINLNQLETEIENFKQKFDYNIQSIDKKINSLLDGQYPKLNFEITKMNDKDFVVETALCSIGGCTVSEEVFSKIEFAYMYSLLRTLKGDTIDGRSACQECYQEYIQNCI